MVKSECRVSVIMCMQKGYSCVVRSVRSKRFIGTGFSSIMCMQRNKGVYMSLELVDWTMRVYVRDRRCKTGERICNTYTYKSKHERWMADEVLDLQCGLYPAERYRIEVDPVWVTVVSLQTGLPVVIRYEDRGGVYDPSQESYWTC